MGRYTRFIKEVKNSLDDRGISINFYKYKLHYYTDSGIEVFNPVIKLDNDIYIDVIDKFDVSTQEMYIKVREQFPLIDIRFVFENSRDKFIKEDKLTYGMWCVSNGFQYNSREVPQSWIDY